MSNKEVQISKLYIATPINSEDKQQFDIRFAVIKNKNVLIISQGQVEEVLYDMNDANDIPEYYTKNFYVQKYTNNKDYYLDMYKSISNVQNLLNKNNEDSVDLKELLLTEKAINSVYLEILLENEMRY